MQWQLCDLEAEKEIIHLDVDDVAAKHEHVEYATENLNCK